MANFITDGIVCDKSNYILLQTLFKAYSSMLKVHVELLMNSVIFKCVTLPVILGTASFHDSTKFDM